MGLNGGWPRSLPWVISATSTSSLTKPSTKRTVLGHEVLHRRRQKQRLIDPPGAEYLAHAHDRIRPVLPWPEKCAFYSDRLLALPGSFFHLRDAARHIDPPSTVLRVGQAVVGAGSERIARPGLVPRCHH